MTAATRGRGRVPVAPIDIDLNSPTAHSLTGQGVDDRAIDVNAFPRPHHAVDADPRSRADVDHRRGERGLCGQDEEKGGDEPHGDL